MGFLVENFMKFILRNLDSMPVINYETIAERTKEFANVTLWDDDEYCPLCEGLKAGKRNIKICQECYNYLNEN